MDEHTIRNILEEVLEAKLDKKLNPIIESIEFISKEYDEFKRKIQLLEETNKTVVKENEHLKQQVAGLHNEIDQMKNNADDQEQYFRRECLEIRGVPVTEQEDTNNITKQIGSLMGLTLEESEISVSHRLPSRSSSSGGTPSPPIIVKFTQRDTRDRFYRLRSKLKDFSTGNIGLGRVAENKIFIQESLTPKKKDLFRNCLEFKKRKSFKFIWTHYGKVFLRKNESSPTITVFTIKDLERLQQAQPG